MKNAWLGYLGSVLVLFAGVLQILGDKPVLGAILIVLSIVGVVIKYYLGKKSGNP